MGKIEKELKLGHLKADPEVLAYIEGGNTHLGVLGYTEHGTRHANLVSSIAGNVLERLDYPERELELAAIAGYLHDIGNVIARFCHAQAGAVLAESLLRERGMPPDEIAVIIGAIGSHDPEESCSPVSSVSAAVILADKSDVHRSRVRNPDMHAFDVHDRVNYSATRSFLSVDGIARAVCLELTVDTSISPVMEYFEIFLTRMVACKRAAEFLKTRFGLNINGVKLL